MFLGFSDVGCLVVQDVGSFLVFRMSDAFRFSDLGCLVVQDVGFFCFRFFGY